MSNSINDRRVDYIEFPAGGVAETKTFYQQVFGWKFMVTPGLYDHNATRSKIAGSLRALTEEAKDEDVVAIYLSGHGQAPSGQEMFYFIPFDVVATDLANTGFSAADLADALRGLRARRVLLIVDACQAGASIEALEKVAYAKAQAELRSGRLNPSGGNRFEPVGVHLLAATMPLSYAVQLKDDRSALAATLLDYFRHGPSQITAKGILSYVARVLPKASKDQVGFEQIPLTARIGQDFGLLKP
jgi:metacaspase-1